MLFAFKSCLFFTVFQEVFHNKQIEVLFIMWMKGGWEEQTFSSFCSSASSRGFCYLVPR